MSTDETRWTPGAGWARLMREAPHLIPDEISEEDLRRADEIIAAANERPVDAPPARRRADVRDLPAAVAYFQEKLAYIDRCAAPYRGMPYAGTVQEEINRRSLVEREHLAVLLRTLGVDVPDLEETP